MTIKHYVRLLQKSTVSTIGLFLSLWLFAACCNEPEKRTTITLEGSEALTLAVGETFQIKYGVNPPSATVTFVAENEDVATVSPEGLITAISKGQTQITLSAGKAIRTIALTVQDGNIVAQWDLRYTSKGVNVLDEFDLPIMTETALSEFDITVSDPKIAKVRGRRVCALAEGDCTITIAMNGVRQDFSLMVLPEVSYDAEAWMGDIYVRNTVELTYAEVIAAEKALGKRENVYCAENTLIFTPRPADQVNGEEAFFEVARYFLNNGARTRTIYDRVSYPYLTEYGEGLMPLKEENAEQWVNFFTRRYPSLYYVMGMTDPMQDNAFYGILFYRNPPFNEGSLSLMMPADKTEVITHFVILPYGDE